MLKYSYLTHKVRICSLQNKSVTARFNRYLLLLWNVETETLLGFVSGFTAVGLLPRLNLWSAVASGLCCSRNHCPDLKPPVLEAMNFSADSNNQAIIVLNTSFSFSVCQSQAVVLLSMLVSIRNRANNHTAGPVENKKGISSFFFWEQEEKCEIILV